MIELLRPLLAVLTVLAVAAAEAVPVRGATAIAWQPPREIARGGYARIHRLRDGRFMCAYSRGPDAFVRFSPDAATWSAETCVARGPRVAVPGKTNEMVVVALANTEFAQLRSGRIVFGINYRPHAHRVDVHPSAIGVTVSDDGGTSWSPLRVVYRATNTADGVLRGCWEPCFLELPDGTVQLYFADETPYVEGRRRFQNITVMDSRDGLIWGEPRPACYAPRCRDGMPVPLIDGERILLAIESNPHGTHLHPQLLSTPLATPWAQAVGNPSPARCEPLADAADFRREKAGAPYLIATATKLVLSWQQGTPTPLDREGFRRVHVAVAERGAFGDGCFRGDFTPPKLADCPSLWNALCPLDGDSFLLIGESKGRILTTEGRIVERVTERICWDGGFADPTLWKGADGRFYAYATPGGANDLAYLVSDDGLAWRTTGKRPFSEREFAAIRKDWRWVWAPDRAVVGGEERLYVSLVNKAEDSAIGVYRVEGTGEARDLHVLTRSRETGIPDTIDPEVVSDPETGKVWLFFGSVGRIHRVELTADGLAVRPGARYEPVAGRPVGESKNREKVFEGSYLHRRDGWWYLFVSAGWYGGSGYNLRVGRSRTLEGRFVDREGRPMADGFATPVLATEGGDFYGPGHNGDILVGKDGVERIYYHCHWKPLDRDGRKPRILLARRLDWDADGWPQAVKE